MCEETFWGELPPGNRDVLVTRTPHAAWCQAMSL